ncbi:MAG: DinB family protein [Sphingobacteriaceae bacterium]
MTEKKASFLEYVLNLNGDIQLQDALKRSLVEIDNLDVSQLERIGLATYAEGKWSVHKIVQHLTDWERIWCYRAVILAREEGTVPGGLDQDIMGENSNADELSIDHLLKDLRLVRQSTIMLFESFNQEILEKNCTIFQYEMPFYGIGYSITAHQIHHFNIIQERYVPLIDAVN